MKENKAKSMTSNKVLQRIIVGIIFIFCFVFIFELYLFKMSTGKVLMDMATETNKYCPIMIDAETRLDNTFFLPPKTFQYNYTLINAVSEAVDTLTLKKHIELRATNLVRTNPDLKFMRDKGVTINYMYNDRAGVYLFQVSISPEQYK